MAKISVVVPVYNMEKLLSRCVDSLINQTFGDIEIILVNDGSTDQSPQICDELALKDSRIKVVHKTNGGLSSARNAGLNRAKGEYIYFADSDDYLHPDAFKILINNAEGYDAVICGYYLDFGNKKAPNFTDRLELNKQTLSNAFPLLKEKCIIDPAWNKLYKLSFLRENSVKFCEGEIFEDTEFNLRLLNCEPNILVISDCLYYYVQRKGSITKRYNPEKLSTLKKRAVYMANVLDACGSEKTYNYCLFWYIKYLFSSFIDLFGSDMQNREITDIIRHEIGEPYYQRAVESANGLKLKNNAVIFIAKTENVFIIKLFCKILFKLRSKRVG